MVPKRLLSFIAWISLANNGVDRCQGPVKKRTSGKSRKDSTFTSVASHFLNSEPMPCTGFPDPESSYSEGSWPLSLSLRWRCSNWGLASWCLLSLFRLCPLLVLGSLFSFAWLRSPLRKVCLRSSKNSPTPLIFLRLLLEPSPSPRASFFSFLSHFPDNNLIALIIPAHFLTIS